MVTLTLRYQALVLASIDASELTVSPAATAPEAANEAPEAPSSAGARKAPKYGDAQLKSQCAHYFSRVANGKATKASSDEVAEAKNALQTFQGLDDVGKLEFAILLVSH